MKVARMKKAWIYLGSAAALVLIIACFVAGLAWVASESYPPVPLAPHTGQP
jgi:hypothetical protein